MDTPEHSLAAPEDTTAETLLAEWLRYQPPMPVADIPGLTGLDPDTVRQALQSLIDSDQVVVDELTIDCATPEVCDIENLGRLLRMTRADARPSFDPLDVDALPVVLATHHGVGAGRSGGEALRQGLEKLFGLPLPASILEEEILPARFADYRGAWLDSLIDDTDLIWIGTDPEKIALCLSSDRDLFVLPPEDAGSGEAAASLVFPDLPGRYSLADLARQTGKPTAEIARSLWDLAWRGLATTDGFATVRQAIATGFSPPTDPEPGRRERFGRWKSSRPTQGAWLRLAPIDPPEDLLESEELDRDRVRALMERHGILFREILGRELPHLRWPALFRTMRIMELSGEIVAGQFFTGIQGLQFISPALLRRLRDPLPDDRIFFVNAADPASACGLGLDLELPRRVSSTHLVYHGRRLVVISEASAKRLTIHAPPDHPRLHEYLAVLDHMLGRDVRPARSLTIEQINAVPAARSPYRALLDARFDVSADARSLRLSRKY
jgi:ATP-dependent Lhr-like helicase